MRSTACVFTIGTLMWASSACSESTDQEGSSGAPTSGGAGMGGAVGIGGAGALGSGGLPSDGHAPGGASGGGDSGAVGGADGGSSSAIGGTGGAQGGGSDAGAIGGAGGQAPSAGGTTADGGAGGAASEAPTCEAVLASALNDDGLAEFWMGSFHEVLNSPDPTGGLVLVAAPTQDGAFFGQMVNTYVDCSGNLSTGGTVAGGRAGDVFNGSWTMAVLQGTFGGPYASAIVAPGEMDGQYTLNSGPLSTCNNPDGSNYGVDGCYCASQGTFGLHTFSQGNGQSTENIPFSIQRNGAPILLQSEDNPNTVADESFTPQGYLIVRLDQLCVDALPVVAMCFNVPGEEPLDASYDAACAISLPFDAGEVMGSANCPCQFLSDYAPGTPYAVIGVNEAQSPLNGGISASNPDAVSMARFTY